MCNGVRTLKSAVLATEALHLKQMRRPLLPPTPTFVDAFSRQKVEALGAESFHTASLMKAVSWLNLSPKAAGDNLVEWLDLHARHLFLRGVQDDLAEEDPDCAVESASDNDEDESADEAEVAEQGYTPTPAPAADIARLDGTGGLQLLFTAWPKVGCPWKGCPIPQGSPKAFKLTEILRQTGNFRLLVGSFWSFLCSLWSLWS